MKRRPCEPLRFMGRRQLIHQKLEQAPVLDRGRGQQVLDQFKHGNDMAFLRRAEFRNQQDDGSEKPFRGIIKERILSIAARFRPIGTDDGLCRNLRILLRFRFGRPIL